MAAISKIQACNLIIFGAKGDLTRRKLFPSLYQLEKRGLIHPKSRIIAVGRANWGKTHYISVVRKALEIFMKEPINSNLWRKLSGRIYFYNLDVNESEKFKYLCDTLNHHVQAIISYFATPPSTFGAICKGLSKAGLNKKFSRVIIEKPLGSDLISSKLINNQVAQYFHEKQIYRVDHYLGKEAVLNLLALRFANSLFFCSWDHRAIDHVQITVAEQVGIEGRWGYFDQIGQMRDMVQSHLLQILAIIAMSPPTHLTADCIRDEKIKVLRSLRPIDYKNIRSNVICGQYTSGYIQGKKVPGYLEEKGANKNSCTETFVSIRVDIDNWQWAGVPFYLRTGKRLPIKYSEIVIYFKSPILNLFHDSYKELPQNKLIIHLYPDEGINIQILNKIPGLDNKHRLQTAKLNLNFTQTFNQKYIADAYERLLLESMCGTQALFVRHDEIEEAWHWIDSIIKAWKLSRVKPQPYQAGTWGPKDSILMLSRDGRLWNNFE